MQQKDSVSSKYVMLLDSVRPGGMTQNRKIQISDSFKRGQARGLAEVSNAIHEEALKAVQVVLAFFKKIDIPINGRM